MKIVVTGGTGFMGSHFARYIVSQGHDVKILSKRTGVSTAASIADILDNIELEELDLQNYSRLCRQVAGCDRVVAYAAESHVTKSIENPEPFIHINVVGTMNLLNACMDMKISKVVLISSCEVYGNAQEVQNEETSPIHPRSPYAASKAGADMLAQSYIHTYNYPIVILRPCNNYGPWQHMEKVIPRFIYLAATDQDLTIHGMGAQKREWIHSEDCARAVSASMDLLPGIYNIGTGHRYSIYEIACKIIMAFPEGKSIVNYTEDREGQVSEFILDRNKFFDATGWIPEYDFTDGLENTISWYRKQFKW